MRRSRFAVLTFVVALVTRPTAAHGQQFSVEKWNIGGEGGNDYITAEPGTGRVFVSRGTHVMVVDGATGKVIGDIPDTPRTHGIALAPKSGHGFTTNGGDSTVTMFDLASLAVIKKIKVPSGRLDGIMYDESDNLVILTNHSRPVGTLNAINPTTGDVTARVELEDDAPEGAVSDGRGRIFVNNEGKNTIQVIDAMAMKVVASWPTTPCQTPTGIAFDQLANRVIAGCSKLSIVIDASSGAVVSTIANGDGVDALGYDPSEKYIYIPAGRSGNVTVAKLDGPSQTTVIATVPTMIGAKTIATDPVRHVSYLFANEYAPADPNTPPAAPGQRPAPRPIVASWLFAIKH